MFVSELVDDQLSVEAWIRMDACNEEFKSIVAKWDTDFNFAVFDFSVRCSTLRAELALIPGEEAGGSGHANALDMLTRIDHAAAEPATCGRGERNGQKGHDHGSRYDKSLHTNFPVFH